MIERSAQVVPLGEPAAQRPEPTLLDRVLHAFADRLVAERVGQLHHGGSQAVRVVAGTQGLDEGLVDLHDVDLEPVEVGERGVSRPEVVERDAHTKGSQLDQVAHGRLVVGEHGALGDLENQRSGIELACLDLRGDPLGQVGIDESAR